MMMMNKSQYETLIDCLSTLGEIKADINTLKSIRSDAKTPTRHAHSNYDDYANYFTELDEYKAKMTDFTTRITKLESEYNRELSALKQVLKSHIFEGVEYSAIRGDYIITIYDNPTIATLTFHAPPTGGVATIPLVEFVRASTEVQTE